jgi:RNA polymerase sigma-70 factor (ECF subfamily)
METARRLQDELLVLGARSGDREAFRGLVQRWQEPLWRHAFRLTGRAEVASDVVQDAWLAIATKIGALRDAGSFPAWAYRIVSRGANAARRRRPALAPSTEIGEVAAPAPDEPSSAVELLRRALRRLPGDRRAILALHYVDGLGLSEIATALAIPEGTVKSRLHTARAELRALVERLQP